MKQYFLDSNAHIPLNKKALVAYINFQNSIGAYGHPLAPSKPAQLAAGFLEESRNKMANLLGVKPLQIVFTSTCTQACEWGINLLKRHSEAIETTYLEHSAVRNVCEQNNANFISVKPSGVIIPEKFKKRNSVACIHVQNEIGTIQPIENINCKLIFSDMCQSVGKVDINLHNVDFAAFGAHKFGGPASVGILYIKNNYHWEEFGSGSRYFNDRPGTPDVGSIIATAVALEEELLYKNERNEKNKEFQIELEDRLIDCGLEIIGYNENRVYNTSFVRVPEKALDILLSLSLDGIYVGIGSACGSMHTGSSPVLKAIGYNNETSDFLRISQHGNYDRKDAIYIFDKIYKLL
jgi:cysteine desulfurase